MTRDYFKKQKWPATLSLPLINYWTHGAESVYESVPGKAEEEAFIKSDAGRGVWWVMGDG